MKMSRKDLLERLEIEREMRDAEMWEREYRVQSGFEYRAVDIIVPKAGCKWDLVEMEWGFIPQY
jgi:hypothetical protein